MIGKAAALVAFLVAAANAQQGVILESNELRVGVDKDGHLNYNPPGPSNAVGIELFGRERLFSVGSLDSEGWAIKASFASGPDIEAYTGFDLGSTNRVGLANDATMTGIDDDTVTTTVSTTDAKLEVSHQFEPSTERNVFKVTVTVTNNAGETMTGLTYSRFIDLDPKSVRTTYRIGDWDDGTSPSTDLIELMYGWKEATSSGVPACAFTSTGCGSAILDPNPAQEVQYTGNVGGGINMDVKLPAGGLGDGQSISFVGFVGASLWEVEGAVSLNKLGAGVRFYSKAQNERAPVVAQVCTATKVDSNCVDIDQSGGDAEDTCDDLYVISGNPPDTCSFEFLCDDDLACCARTVSCTDEVVMKTKKVCNWIPFFGKVCDDKTVPKTTVDPYVMFWAFKTDEVELSSPPEGLEDLGTNGECFDDAIFDEFDSNFAPIIYEPAPDAGCQVCGLDFDDFWMDKAAFDPQPVKPMKLEAEFPGPMDCSGSVAIALNPDGEAFRAPMYNAPGSVNICLVNWFGVFPDPDSYNFGNGGDPQVYRVFFALKDLGVDPGTKIWVDDADASIVPRIITGADLSLPILSILPGGFKTVQVPETNTYEVTVELELSDAGSYEDSDGNTVSCTLPDTVTLELGDDSQSGVGGASSPECTKTLVSTGAGEYKVTIDIDDIGDCGEENPENFQVGMKLVITQDNYVTVTEEIYCHHDGLFFGIGTCPAETTAPREYIPKTVSNLLLTKTGDASETTQQLTQLIVTVGEPGFENCTAPGYTPTAHMIIPVEILGASQVEIQDFIDAIQGESDYTEFLELITTPSNSGTPSPFINGEELEFIPGTVDFGCDGTFEEPGDFIPTPVTTVCFDFKTIDCLPMHGVFGDADPVTGVIPVLECSWVNPGSVSIAVKTCCEIAEVKRTVVTGKTFDEGCPPLETNDDVTPFFDLTFEGTCPKDGAEDRLFLNAEVIVEMGIVGFSNLAPNPDETVSITLVMDNVEVTLKDETGQAVGYRYFNRAFKTFQMQQDASAYEYDAHFCRSLPQSNLANIYQGGAEYVSPDTDTCVPFYRLAGNQNGETGGEPDGNGGFDAFEADYSEPLQGYEYCQDMSDRNVDRFIFTPNEWIYDRFEGTVGTMEITATATLTGCKDPETARRALRELVDSRRDLQIAAFDNEFPDTLSISRTFELFNVPNFAQCGSITGQKAEQKCSARKNCGWTGDECVDRDLLRTLPCSTISSGNGCNRHGECYFESKVCRAPPNANVCSDYGNNRGLCLGDRSGVAQTLGAGHKCVFFKNGCHDTADLKEYQCGDLNKGFCGLNSGCKKTKTKCVAKPVAPKDAESCAQYLKVKHCNKNPGSVVGGCTWFPPGGGPRCKPAASVTCASASSGTHCKKFLGKKCAWKGSPKQCVPKNQ